MGISMAVLCGLTRVWAIATFVEVVMPTVILAITIDSNFSLLVRSNGEITDAPDEKRRAVVHTVGFAGQVISISFLWLIFLGVGTINYIGIGCVIALLIMIWTSLRCGPLLLLAFPNFLRSACVALQDGRHGATDLVSARDIYDNDAVIVLIVIIVITVPVIVGCHGS
jgi:predicted RND superfamily exporter protein